MLTTIRTFRHGGLHAQHRYRHAMDFDTDDVLLQRLNPDAEMPEDEWTTLLRYDRNCNAWNAKTGKCIGVFRMRGKNWVFEPPVPFEPSITPMGPSEIEPNVGCIVCQPYVGAESLLNSEVTISMRWLHTQ